MDVIHEAVLANIFGIRGCVVSGNGTSSMVAVWKGLTM
ncbi:hypothetical protein CCP4SC76_2580007 [Gammaproteobacteria bacterium]